MVTASLITSASHVPTWVCASRLYCKYRKVHGVRQEILYFPMLQTRMEFVSLTGMALTKACTIAIRYSAVREQGYDANDAKATTELKVLDYQSQQYRLLPQLATAYAIMLSGNQVNIFRVDLARQIQGGGLSMLDVGHAMSCGLKVFVSDAASNGIEVCRWACGGHGYLLASVLPVLLGDVVQTVTAEGENYVLTLQTGRSLLKTLGHYRSSGKLPSALCFLSRVDESSPPNEQLNVTCKHRWRDPRVYVAAFERRFLYLLRDLEQRVASSNSTAAGVQNHSIASYKLSMAYAKLVLVQNFVAAVASPQSFTKEGLSTTTVLVVVRLLCHLFALTQLEADAGEFMECGAVRPEQVALIRTTIEELLPQIRTHAVVLVDAFNFSDHSLNSALDRYDGNVYGALYEAAQHDPVNQASHTITLEELLVPIRQAVRRARL